VGARFAWAVALLLPIALTGCTRKTTGARPGEARTATSTQAKVSAGAASVGPKVVPLDIKLPRPAFISQVCRFPPDVETRAGPRPPVMVPVGTRNVALGKPVTASDWRAAGSELELVTDGDKEGTRGNYLNLAPGPQYVQIDLGAEHEIHAVLFWHRHDRLAVFHDVAVQVADDADFITGVKTLFNNDGDNSLGLGVGKDREYIDMYEGKLVEARDVKARHVRLYSNGSTDDEMNRYTEVEVYGLPAE